MSQLNFDSVIIVTYGRSGSTLLQGLLNDIDGVLIRGENNNFIEGLFIAYQRLSNAKKNFGTPQALQTTFPWFGAKQIDVDQFLDSCQSLVKKVLIPGSNLPESNICYGFKEIRFHLLEDEFESYLDFLALIFPKVCFIFNTRNLDNVLQSSFWKTKDPLETRSALSALQNKMKAYGKKHPGRTFHLRYEDMVRRSVQLQKMFQFLGAPYFPHEIERVLNKPHSFMTNQIVPSNDNRIYYEPYFKYNGFVSHFFVNQIPEQIMAEIPFLIEGILAPANEFQVESMLLAYSGGFVEAVLEDASTPFGSRLRFMFQNIALEKEETLKMIAQINGESSGSRIISLGTINLKPE